MMPNADRIEMQRVPGEQGRGGVSDGGATFVLTILCNRPAVERLIH